MSQSRQPAGIPRLLRTFGPDLWAHRRAVAIGYLLSLVSIVAGLVGPWPLKIIIDSVLANKPLPEFVQALDIGLSPDLWVIVLALVFMMVTAIGGVAAARERVVEARVREKLSLELRDRLLAHLQTLPPTIRTSHRSGELVLRLVGDVELFVRLQTKTLPLLVRHALTVVSTLAVMVVIQPRLGLLCLALVPGFYALLRFHGHRLRAASRQKRRKEGEVAGLAQEIVRGLPAVQALGGDRHTRQRFAQLNAESLRAGVSETRVGSSMERNIDIARGLAVALVTGVGAVLVLHGQLSIGELTVFGAYTTLLMKPVDKVNELLETVSRAIVGGERLVSLLDLCPAVQDAPDAVDIGRARGVVELRDVTFAYPGAEDRLPVLRGASLRVEPGRLGVIIGTSGAGKSTLMSLLVRLFDPSSGTITLDGRPLREMTLRSLRSQIAVMAQETHLFAGTIRAAVSPDGDPIDEDRLWEALALVALDEFVRELPLRLDTPLGEDGLNLSGGQRQRLSLARAFLLDRPILLLDEPLANVDSGSAAVILKALDRLRVGRTCLAITHQPDLLDYADIVYRLEGGRIVEDMGSSQERRAG